MSAQTLVIASIVFQLPNTQTGLQALVEQLQPLSPHEYGS